MKKRLLLLIVVTLLAAMLIAPVAAQDRPDLLIWADITRAPALEELLAQFSEEFGVTAEVQEIGFGDIRSNLTIAGPAGEGPDILIGAHDWLGEFIQNGIIVPIDLGDKAAEFSPSALDLFTVDGVLYGMPYAVENLAFFRNTDLVPDAPETWDEVFTISQELVDSGAAEAGWVLPNTASYDFYPVMSAFGGYVFARNEDGTFNPGDVGIGSDGTIAAGEYVKQYVDGGYITPGIDGDVMVTLFTSGDAAMMMTGPWFLNRVRESGVPFAISDIPAGPAGQGAPFIGGQGFMISAFSENQLLAQAFLTDFMATSDAMLAMYNIDPRPPAYLPALESITEEAMGQFQSAGANGIPQPAIPEMASVWGSWGNALQFIINGELEPADAYTQAEAQIVEAIGTISAAPTSVALVGTIQTFLGCPGDWDPACEAAFMTDNGDGTYSITTSAIPAGEYEGKIAFDGNWDRNFGVDGTMGGDNYMFTVPADGTELTFTFNTADNVLTIDGAS
ncbi:MAG: extracellular solute-binding protein [Chloroflexota bacterium]|nr:extracellular solute-binding protein [Chloroflexota bacterium]